MRRHLPLALEQAAAYLVYTKRVSKIDEYARELKAKMELVHKRRPVEGGYPSNLLFTFQDCVDCVRGKENGADALALLHAMAFMDGAAGIPVDGLLSRLVDDAARAVGALLELSLVSSSGDEVRVHSLVQAMTLQEECG